MPSTFPPPSVERHHSRRRSGRQDDPEAQTGNYQQRISHENTPRNSQDPYYQATSAAGAYQTLNPSQQQQHYNPTHDSIQAQQALSDSQNTSTYQPPTSSHAPHQSSHHQRNTGHGGAGGSSGGLLSTFKRRGAHTDGRKSNRGPDGHNLQHQPSPFDYKSQGGRWEEIRGHIVAMSGEFVGTVMFLWFALSAAQVTSMSNPDSGGSQTPQTLLFIALAFGFSLTVNAWAFYRISGGLFNPAVVVGMVVAGSLPWMRGLFLIPAQLLGCMVAAALVQCMFPGDVGATITRLNPDVSIARGLFIEMFLTALLVFTILMLAAEKHQATFLAPVGIGLSLFVAELTGKLTSSLTRFCYFNTNCHLQEYTSLVDPSILHDRLVLLSPPAPFLAITGSTGLVPY